MQTQSTIEKVVAAGVSLDGLTLKPVAVAIGLTFFFANGIQVNPAKIAAVHLYSTTRKTPDQARLDKFELPANLAPDKYQLSARLQKETDPLMVEFSVQAAAPVVVANPPASNDDGDDEPMTPSHLIKGVCVDVMPPAASQVIRLDGSVTTLAAMNRDVWKNRTARLWCSVTIGQPPVEKWMADRVAWCKAMGFETIIFVCTPVNGAAIVPAASQIKAWFTAFAKLCANRGIKIVVELVNEPNQAAYWKPLSLKLLIDTFVNPAIDVLSAAGIEYTSPSPTGSVDTMKGLITYGMKLVKAFAFHPYCKTLAALQTIMAGKYGLLNVTGTTPVDFTEFNAFLGQEYNAGKPADEVIEVQLQQWAYLRTLPTVRNVCYFILIIDKASTTGPLSLVKRDNASPEVLKETQFSRDFWAKVA